MVSLPRIAALVLAAGMVFGTWSTSSARRPRRKNVTLRKLVTRCEAIVVAKVQRVLPRSKVKVAGRTRKLGRRRIKVVSVLKGKRSLRGRRLVIVDAPPTWGTFRAGQRRSPRRGRLIAFLRRSDGRWHVGARAGYLQTSRRSSVRNAIRRAALVAKIRRLSIVKLLGSKSSRGVLGGSVRVSGLSRLSGLRRRPARLRRYRGRYVRLTKVVARYESGDKKALKTVEDKVKARASNCRMRRSGACVVKMRFSVSPTYGGAAEFQTAKRNDCGLRSWEKKCLDRQLRDVDAGGSRLTALMRLYYTK